MTENHKLKMQNEEICIMLSGVIPQDEQIKTRTNKIKAEVDKVT